MKPRARKAKGKPAGKMYEYSMEVVERTRNNVIVRSRRKLTYQEAHDRAERARINGKLICEAVEDVRISCRAAKVNGKWTQQGRVFADD